MRATLKYPVTVIALSLFGLAGCDQLGPPEGDTVEAVSAALTGALPVIGGARVACGGPAVGAFLADTNSDGAGAIKTRAVTVATAGVANAAPAAVYQSQRYQNATGGSMTYTFTGLAPQMPTNVRLHFAETNPANNVVGKRLFNVAINGTTVLSRFDMFATAGLNKAIVEPFTTTADAQGKVAIKLTQVADAASVSGIEVFQTATSAGDWTAKAAPKRYDGSTATFGAGAQPQLLTDGSILLGDGSFDGTAWFKLTPDVKGSYENGTWTQVGSSNRARQYYPSTLLPTGKFLIAGGEDAVGDPNHSDVDVYDPVADSWSLRQTFPDPAGIGDTAGSILPDGHWYTSCFTGPNTYTYDAANDIWAFAGTVGTLGSGDEKGWTLLQTGEIFDIFGNWSVRSPSTGKWSAAAALPAGMSLVSQFASNEVGAASLLYDGRVIQFGSADDANGLGTIAQTALFDPKTKSLVQGPSAPDALQWGDTSADVMINGHVLNVTSTSIMSGSNVTSIWEYDPTQPVDSAFTKVATKGADLPAAQRLPNMGFPVFLQLPNGQVFSVESNDTQVHFYMPKNGQSAVSPAWKPTIASVTGPTAGEFTLSGTRINGLTLGATFGDDRNSSTNFPVVWLQDSSNNIFYARTYGFSSMTPDPTATHTCKFVLPPAIPDGTYQVHVSANGVASSNTTALTISGVHVTSVSGPTVVTGGNATWTVKTSATATAAQTVTLSTDNANVAQPTVTTLTIPAGATSATFTVAGRGPGLARISAALSPANTQFQPAVGIFGAAVQSVRPFAGIPRPQFLGPSPKAQQQTWTVTISNPAPTGGMVVSLSSSASSIVVPATVTVLAGSRTATFLVKRGHPSPTAPRPIPPTMSGLITASMNGSSKDFPMAIRARNDVNGDGISDIALSGGQDFTGMPVVLSNGDGSFSFLTQMGETNGDTNFRLYSSMLDAKVVDGDFDDDGVADMAVLGVSASDIPLAFSQTGQFDGSGNPLPMGSFRGTDVPVIAASGPNGDASFATKAAMQGVQPLSGDFNGDGSTDIALTGSTTFPGIPVAFSLSQDYDRFTRRNGNGQFAGTNGTITSTPSGVNFVALASSAGAQAVAGDFNGDGKTDVAIFGVGSHIPVAFSHGDGNFDVTNGTASSVGESGFQTLHIFEGASAVVGDFNGDGKSDIAVVAGMSTTSLNVALSNGDGSFKCSTMGFSASSTDPNFATYATLEGARLAVGDFDGDGFDDLAVTGGVGWGSIPVAFSNGDNTFKGVNIGGTQAQPFYALASDPGAAPITTPVTDRIIDLGAWRYDTDTVCNAGGTAMHCCPPGYAMIGVHIGSDTFKCAPLMSAGGTISRDTGTIRNGMHTCPFGQVMVGLQANLDQYACQTIPGNPITTEDVDHNSVDAFPMRVCNDTRFAAMSGLQIGPNLLSCTVGN